jgi:hypothetical protein
MIKFAIKNIMRLQPENMVAGIIKRKKTTEHVNMFCCVHKKLYGKQNQISSSGNSSSSYIGTDTYIIIRVNFTLKNYPTKIAPNKHHIFI